MKMVANGYLSIKENKENVWDAKFDLSPRMKRKLEIITSFYEWEKAKIFEERRISRGDEGFKRF